MPNPYIEFFKRHPQLAGESATERVRRVSQLWRQLKNDAGSVTAGYSTGFIPPRSSPINIPQPKYLIPQ